MLMSSNKPSEYEDGYNDGYDDAEASGINQGRLEMFREMMHLVLAMYHQDSSLLEQPIMFVEDGIVQHISIHEAAERFYKSIYLNSYN